jgi:hypothetical protein
MVKGSYEMMGRDHTLVYRWIRAKPAGTGSVKCGALWKVKNKLWVIKAIELWPGCLGGRDTAIFRRLYDKVKHLMNYRSLGCVCRSSAA